MDTSEEEEEYDECSDKAYDPDYVWCDICDMWSDMSYPYGTCMCS
jgi:hypothetical protein